VQFTAPKKFTSITRRSTSTSVSEALADSGQRPAAVLFGGDVAAQGQGVGTGGLQLGCPSACSGFVSVQQRDPRTFLGEAPSQDGADPASGAGDHDAAVAHS
jgi:hypothetical protein